MEMREKLGSGKSVKDYVNPCDSFSQSCTSPRNFQNWPNEWESVFNDSESSDFLSQSVASSNSWSDELEGDLTKALQDQMRLVENTLYRDGNQKLSARSNLREECRLWQKNFAHLRIVGNVLKTSVACQTRTRQEEIEEQLEEIIAAHGNYEDHTSTKSLEKKKSPNDANEVYKEKVKKAVIDQIFARIWPEVVKKIEPVLRKATENQSQAIKISPDLNKKRNSFDDGLISEFDSLSVVDDIPRNSLRTRSGRVSIGKNVTPAVSIKPVVLECSIPIPSSVINRTSSALRRSPGRSFSNLPVKNSSPDRLRSPLVLQSESKTIMRSSGVGKVGGCGNRKQECRQRPQYDAQTGRIIRDTSRSGIRRNLKTSPSLPWSRHGALPPIEVSDIVPKSTESGYKRSSSAFYKGRLDSGSRPNTSVATKNQVVLSPLDQIRQPSVAASKHWLPEQHAYVNCEVLQLNPAEKRLRWKTRSNVVKK